MVKLATATEGSSSHKETPTTGMLILQEQSGLESESENHSVVSDSLRPHGLYITAHGILQARILEWVAVPFSRGSSQHRDQTQVSHIAGRLFTIWATRGSCIELGLAICLTYDNTRFNAILSNHPTLAFSHRVQKSVLYICVSFAVSHIGSSLPSF